MVTEFLLNVLSTVITAVLGLLHFPDVPDAMTAHTGVFATVASWLHNTGSWIPWTFIQALIVVWVATFLVGGAFKMARIILSFLTAGGGSAA